MGVTTYKKVRFVLSEVSADPVQYKPYSPRLTSENVTVTFDVPTELFDGDDLTPDGVAYICEQMATSIQTMHLKHAAKMQKLYNQ